MRIVTVLLLTLLSSACRQATTTDTSTATTTTTTTAEKSTAEKAFDAGERARKKAESIKAEQDKKAKETDDTSNP